MPKRFPTEFVYQVFALLLAIIVVHAVYVTVIRPKADLFLAEQTRRVAAQPDLVPERSAYVVIRDLEQEACFIMMLWAFAIMGYKAMVAYREGNLLERDFIAVSPGIRILPEDTRELARQVQALPESAQSLLLPRTLLAALQRFEATRNVQDVATAARQLCHSESERLDSERATIRYIAWAIPSVGFIGTVRGIGEALGQAHQAVAGDITGVTQSLGVAFNSTLIALLISIVLMFFINQLELFQERVVHDTESYCDNHLVRHMQMS